MKMRFWIAILLCTGPLVGMANLLPNGDFSDGLEGWLTDYTWTRNMHYMQNHYHISVIPEHRGRRNVAELRGSGDSGVKMETILFPFRMGDSYRATLYIQGRHRVYFKGYQWRPGVRPHDSPTHPEMREIYRSRANAAHHDSMRKVTIEIPGVENLSPNALAHLQRVRFISLFIWSEFRGYVDDVVIEKIESAR